ncbi:hypothetical protein N9544_02890 [Flavobacteriales bacterium]|jgi:hypothetical protein|nr:hypothetical protein [Flavobacteriales bacterium]
MNKTNFIIKTTTLIGILLFLNPFCASAEAGKGITDESIIIALSALVVLVINQVFLTITSFKKIMKPEVKSSILHFVSFVIAIIIFAIYIPNAGPGGLPLFKAFVTFPLILGIISFSITIFNWIKKKS